MCVQSLIDFFQQCCCFYCKHFQIKKNIDQQFFLSYLPTSNQTCVYKASQYSKIKHMFAVYKPILNYIYISHMITFFYYKLISTSFLMIIANPPYLPINISTSILQSNTNCRTDLSTFYLTSSQVSLAPRCDISYNFEKLTTKLF